MKKVQYPTGEVVGEIGLNEFTARKARLEAERDDREEITFPDELNGAAGDGEIYQLLASQRKVVQLRKTARFGQKAQLIERIAQLREEIEGQRFCP